MNRAMERIRGAVRAEAEAEAAHVVAEAREGLRGLLEEARVQEERKALWYALRYAGHRVDILTEKDCADDDGYVYCCRLNYWKLYHTYRRACQ